MHEINHYSDVFFTALNGSKWVNTCKEAMWCGQVDSHLRVFCDGKYIALIAAMIPGHTIGVILG